MRGQSVAVRTGPRLGKRWDLVERQPAHAVAAGSEIRVQAGSKVGAPLTKAAFPADAIEALILRAAKPNVAHWRVALAHVPYICLLLSRRGCLELLLVG